MKIISQLCFLFFLYLTAALSQGAEGIGQQEGEAKAKVNYNNFTFDPNSFTFEGDFFRYADNVVGQLESYYQGKLDKTKYVKLPLEQHKLTSLKENFTTEKEGELSALKKVKILRKEKDDSTLDSNEMKEYKKLKEEKFAIRLQESILEGLKSKCEKYEQNLSYLSYMYGTPGALQDIFYLISDNPYGVNLLTIPCSRRGISKEYKTLNTSGLGMGYVYQDQEGKKPINIIELQETSGPIFKFLGFYVANFLYKEKDFGKYGGCYLECKQALEHAKTQSAFTWLPGSGLDEIDNFMKDRLAKGIKKFDEKIENKTRPLYEYHSRLIQEIENFKKEIEEKIKEEVAKKAAAS